MKRFASHYVFLPELGFVKQFAVEINAAGNVTRIFPLTEEIESVEWLPGVIVLHEVSPEEKNRHAEEDKKGATVCSTIAPSSFQYPVISSDTTLLEKQLCAFVHKKQYKPFLYYPFNFTSMQPADGTQRKLLQ